MKKWNGKTVHQYAHIKRDGFNVRIRRRESGLIEFVTRNHNRVDLTFLPVVASLYERMPKGWEIMAELWKPDEPASYITSGIAQADPEMQLDAFEVKRGIPYRWPLERVELEVRRIGMSFIPYYAKEDHGTWSCMGRWDLVQDLPIGGDIEGYVFKDFNGGEHFKYKPFRELTLQVVSCVPGKGKFEGMIGALVCCDASGREVANVFGMTDDERQIAPEDWIGKFIDVKFQSIGSGGRLRHPTFIKLRSDKDKADHVTI